MSQQLRAVTYLCPSLPVELFQAILEILEQETGLTASLLYDWRADGPSNAKPDPFQNNTVDIGFMSSTGYINLERNKNEFVELLPVTPIFKHSRNEDESSGCFVDIVVHADKLGQHVGQLSDLRGCRFACTHERSLSSYVCETALRSMGENITFFGVSHRVDSNLEAINMVLSKKVEAAAIDAAALTCHRSLLHNSARDVVTLVSYGPYSPYAIVVNKRLDPALKKKITNSFLKMDGKNPKFHKFGLLKFKENSKDFYEVEKQLISNVVIKVGGIRYY